MLDTQSTTFFLNLEEAYVIDSTDTTLTIELPRKKHPCPVCGQRTDKIHDYRLQKVKHIPLLHKSYELFFRKRRYYCPHCAKRFAETVPFLGKFQRMSHLLKQFLLFHLVKDGIPYVEAMHSWHFLLVVFHNSI